VGSSRHPSPDERDSRPAFTAGDLPDNPSYRVLRAWWDVPEVDDSERRFIERLVAHDERAFNELVERYQTRVYHLVYRMLGRQDEAEDMTQEVFVQVFKAIGQFRGECKLSTWVYRVTSNLCKNRLKYLSRRHDGAQDELEAVAERAPLSQGKGVTFGDVARPDHMVEGYQVESIVQRCLAEIEPEFREVLVLRDIEDLSYEEIAEITGVADGTVKSRIHRARAALKAKVERAHGESI
jgi:RNA polymerase sigma-70 factor, ECF subfamily